MLIKFTINQKQSTKKLIDAIPEGKLDDIKRHLESRKQSSLSKNDF